MKSYYFPLFAFSMLAVLIVYIECCPSSNSYKREQFSKRCHDQGAVVVDSRCIQVKVLEVEP